MLQALAKTNWTADTNREDACCIMLPSNLLNWVGVSRCVVISKVSPRAGAMGEWTKHLSMTPRQHDFRQFKFQGLLCFKQFPPNLLGFILTSFAHRRCRQGKRIKERDVYEHKRCARPSAPTFCQDARPVN